ncbi:response receiver sensor diguanylate cyclase/phosphodiesterase, PAS domain-containing [Syntrophotalea carbinolica DSM 2380]|uniref:Response receiver sensor diguanylate cyclase/phosphodiesterase, PAS domain-containing n=1 Tax=Syntrophotalea carbinolica (strain DSM 2380 / NBRC 103641 / GraBd1) TaxID=338963 RepID=Q3A1F4_SYNC1|nr:GGDEF domain-containing response regulator [Syntrophotalea carbinolica]ABA89803.1 response receiver sensor diguanylate cyclase/phosphodiesterase, PAS domain-containing [Syntrophotalea carbinolica DSM 2380]
MTKPLNLLLAEDCEDDALLLIRALRHGGYRLTVERVETAEAMRAALATGKWDLIISDYSMPRFSALAALEVARENGLDLPFIVLSGNIGEETAVEAMRAGAHDYVMKGNLARLLPAIERELREAEERRRRRRAELELRNSEKLFRSIFQNAVTGMATCSPDGRFLKVNPALCEMLGYSENELFGVSVLDITHPTDIELTERLFAEAMGGQTRSHDYEKRYIRRDGETLWAHVSTSWHYNEDGTPSYSVALISNITPHHQAKQKIRQLAYFDGLTGLPNRQLFLEHCNSSLTQARRNRSPLGVCIIDIDRFKGVNDTYGYESGDALLKTVSQRLSDCMSREDVLARLGSDEFAAVIASVGSQDEFSVLAQKMLHCLTEPIQIGEQKLYCSGGMGIALFPVDGVDAEALLKNAATAMHQAKQHGSNNFRFFSKGMNRMAWERIEIETGLRRALDLQQLALHYQPQVDLKTGHIIGMEALLRWESPELGRVSPMRFIPLAEETGLILPIGNWVLESACRQAKAWHRAGFPSLRMAVNISARQFKQAGFIDRLDAIIQRSGINPELLEMELTESLIMEKSDETLMTLVDIKSRGIKLAIDDFGTGYSMLSYLKHFPIDRIKVDRSFVRDIPENTDDAAITEAIIAMAHSLKIEVIAEGIETREQLAFLKDRACEEGQGYYFGRPVPVETAAEILAQQYPRGGSSLFD